MPPASSPSDTPTDSAQPSVETASAGSLPPKHSSPKISFPLVLAIGAGIILLFITHAFLRSYYFHLQHGSLLTGPAPTTAPVATPIPTSNTDIENWKTYRNTKYNFETKYHPDSLPSEQVGSETTGQFTYLLLIEFGHGYELKVEKQKSMDGYRSELIGHITDKIDLEGLVEINDNIWTKINYQVPINTAYIPTTTAIVNHEGYGYAITSASGDIEQILSTFRFVDEAESTGINDWKTYTNHEYGFQLQYPGNWPEPSDKKTTTQSGNSHTTVSLLDELYIETRHDQGSTPITFERYIKLKLDNPQPIPGLQISAFTSPEIEQRDDVRFILLAPSLPSGNIMALIYLPDKINSSTIYQILSTFKFIDSEASIVTGSIISYNTNIENDQLIGTFQLTAQGTGGPVNEMMVWNDQQSEDQARWQAFQDFVRHPMDGADFAYIKFRDIQGNISAIYSDSINPQAGPPDAPYPY